MTNHTVSTGSGRAFLAAALGLLATTASAADTSAAGTGWQQVGWGGGAYYFTASWHPTDGNVIYLGSDCAGIYRTADKGQQWKFINAGLPGYAVYSSAVGPANPDQLWVLTTLGLAHSADQGRTWKEVPESASKRLDIAASRDASVRAVAIDPKQADTVYAGSHTGRLFKTTDAGTSWNELTYRAALPTPATAMFSGTGALSLSYDAQAPGSASMGRVSRFYGDGTKAQDWSGYTRLTAHFKAPEGVATAVQGSLVVQSGDGWKWQEGTWAEAKGGEWVEASFDLTTLADAKSVRMIHFQLRSLATGWKGDVQLDAVTLHGAGDSTKVLADWETKGDTDGWAANKQAKDSLRVTAASQSAGPKSNDVVGTVAVAASQPATIYVGNSRLGVFRSDDAGATWKALESGPKSIKGLTVSDTDPAVVWASAGSAGLFRTSDRGATWTRIAVTGADAKASFREVALPAAKPGRVYAIATIGWGGFLFVSDDDGATWTMNNKVKMGLPGNPTNPDEHTGFPPGYSGMSTVTNIAVNPKNPDEIYMSGNWRNQFSGDGGKTLEERSTGADNTCATDIQFLGGKTYATAMDEGLLVSDNDGGTWRQLLPLKYDPNLSGHFWRVRAVPNGDSVRIVATGSPWNTPSDPKLTCQVHVSDDAGAHFTTTIQGLPDYVPAVNCMWGRSHPRALAVDPKDPKIMYVGFDGDAEPAKGKEGGGIFRSTDGGHTWTRCPGQPGSRRMYYGLVVDPSDSKRLYWSACGDNGGTWRSEDSGATWEHAFKTDSWNFNCEIAPSGMILVGGKELHRSDDHGRTWKQITKFGGDPTVLGIAIDPKDENRIWVSRTTWSEKADGDIHRSLDGGKTWEDITGDIPINKVQILRFNAATGDLWAAGPGIFKIAQPH